MKYSKTASFVGMERSALQKTKGLKLKEFN